MQFCAVWLIQLGCMLARLEFPLALQNNIMSHEGQEQGDSSFLSQCDSKICPY